MSGSFQVPCWLRAAVGSLVANRSTAVTPLWGLGGPLPPPEDRSPVGLADPARMSTFAQCAVSILSSIVIKAVLMLLTLTKTSCRFYSPNILRPSQVYASDFVVMLLGIITRPFRISSICSRSSNATKMLTMVLASFLAVK